MSKDKLKKISDYFCTKRKITSIVIHTTDSPDSMDIGVKEIDDWHRGRGWKEIGYHFVARREGKLEKGRDLDKPGAHVKGHNANSIGIVWVGRDKMTDDQRLILLSTVNMLMKLYGLRKDQVLGHREFSGVRKTCPNIDMDKFRKEL